MASIWEFRHTMPVIERFEIEKKSRFGISPSDEKKNANNLREIKSSGDDENPFKPQKI